MVFLSLLVVSAVYRLRNLAGDRFRPGKPLDHARGGAQFKRHVRMRDIENARGPPGHQAELRFRNAEAVHSGIDGKKMVCAGAVPRQREIGVNPEAFAFVQLQPMRQRGEERRTGRAIAGRENHHIGIQRFLADR